MSRRPGRRAREPSLATGRAWRGGQGGAGLSGPHLLPRSPYIIGTTNQPVKMTPNHGLHLSFR